jgi:hemerythrin superfamily protein
LLEADHEAATKLFKQFKTASDKNDHDKREMIVDEIIAALTVHATIEEEIFYPAVKKARADHIKDEVREAYEEHAQIKVLLAALGKLTPEDDSYDAKVKVLKEDVEHHVKEEEGEMFPDAEKILGKERLEILGNQLTKRKEELSGLSPETTKKPETAHHAAK